MKKPTFQIAIRFLRFCTTLGLLGHAIFLIIIVGSFLWHQKLGAPFSELEYLTKPRVRVPIELNFRDHTDTTITFRNKQHPEMGNDLYHSTEGFDFDSRKGHKKHNEAILDRYNKGIYEAIDTTLSYVYADYEPKGVKDTMPFRFSKPKFVKGQIWAEPIHADEYGWVKWVNIFSTFLNLLLFWGLLWFLRGLLLNFERLHFFSLVNFRKIQKIGLILILIQITEWIGNLPNKLIFHWLNPTAQFQLVHSDLPFLERLFYLQKGNNLTFHLTLIPFESYVFIGVMLIIFSEIFRYGLILQQEQDLTI